MDDCRMRTQQTGAFQGAEFKTRFEILWSAFGNMHQKQIDLVVGELTQDSMEHFFVEVSGCDTQGVFHPFVARTRTIESRCPVEIPCQPQNTPRHNRVFAPPPNPPNHCLPPLLLPSFA